MSHGRRGGGRGARNAAPPGSAPPSKVDLIPTIPPLYPNCSPPEALDENLKKYVTKFTEMTQYMISNYSIDKTKSRYESSAFTVERYSDCYSAPMKLDKSLMHQLDPRRLPQELGPKSRKNIVKSKDSQKRAEIKPKLAFFEKLNKASAQDQNEMDQDQEEEKEEEDDDEPPKKKVKQDTDANEDDEEKQNAQDVDEHTEEEVDEELDEGTDYMSSYFDNGEGFGDSDEDNMEDGSVY